MKNILAIFSFNKFGGRVNFFEDGRNRVEEVSISDDEEIEWLIKNQSVWIYNLDIIYPHRVGHHTFIWDDKYQLFKLYPHKDASIGFTNISKDKFAGKVIQMVAVDGIGLGFVIDRKFWVIVDYEPKFNNDKHNTWYTIESYEDIVKKRKVYSTHEYNKFLQYNLSLVKYVKLEMK